jgi:nicotinate-nucleotide adenylyltransferase
VLIFGGTFDPPHRAHVLLPPLVAERLGCEHILYVPAAINPLKTDSPPTPAHHRLEMLRLALRDVRHAEVCTLELERPGPSYTVETLEELRRRYGDDVEMRLLIGADQAMEFHRWKDWRRIIETAEPAVMLRPPWDESSFVRDLSHRMGEEEALQWCDRLVSVPEVPASASEIRERLRAGEDLDDILDPAVLDYAREHRLYGVKDGP